MIKKRLLPLFIAACTAVSAFQGVYADTSNAEGVCGASASWSFDGSTLTVRGSGSMFDFIYNENSDSVSAPWNAHINSITDVVIEEGITSIGDYAFFGADKLRSVTLPDGVVCIGTASFAGTPKLTEIELPAATARVEDAAFRNSGLLSFTVYGDMELEFLGNYAFDGCTDLSEVTFDGYVGYMGIDVFSDTEWEKSQTDEYIYIEDILYKYSGDTKQLASAVIDDGTVGIAGKAFYGCTELSEVVIPESVVFIGDSAFSQTTSLASIELPAGLEKLGYAAFSDSGLETIHIPDGITELRGTFSRCAELYEVSLPENLAITDDFAFFACTSLSSITLPENMTKIGSFSFACSGIEAINIPDGVTDLGEYAFYSCTKLSSVEFSDSLSVVGSSAFSGCTEISEISLPESTTTVKSYAFSGCTKLKRLVMLQNIITVGKNAVVGSLPVIYGYAGTYAENFAAGAGLEFVAFDSEDDVVLEACFVKQGAKNGIGTYDAPFATLEEAFAALNGKDAIVYVIDDYNITDFSPDPWEGHITVTGYSEHSLLILDGSRGTRLNGSVTFRNIAIAAGKYSHFNGNDLGFDLGDNNAVESILHFPSIEDTSVEYGKLTIDSGRIQTAYLFGAYSTSYDTSVTGNIDFTMNGGSIGRLILSADLYTDTHTGITVEGNVNIVLNDGDIVAIARNSTTAPTIKGALNIIFANGLEQPSAFNYPDTAEKGVYIINSDKGGKILPTDTAGVFEVKADTGKAAVINGTAYADGNVTLSPGEYDVVWEDNSVLVTETYYVSAGASGNGSYDSPFGKIEDAITALDGKNGNVCILGEYDISTFSKTSWDGLVIVKGYDENSLITLAQSYGVLFRGDIEFSDIAISAGNASHFNPHNSTLTIDIGDENIFDSFMHLSSFASNMVNEANFVLDSGTVSKLYAFGGYCTSYSYGVIGDSNLVINGGTVNSLSLSADRYMESHTGISVGGNANIILNGGTVGQITYNSETAPHIMGAMNLVFNNGTAENLGSISIPDGAAVNGIYVIRSGVGGTVLPTAEAGVFSIKADTGMAALVNGRKIDDGTVVVPKGTSHVEWVSKESLESILSITLESDTLTIAPGEAAILGYETDSEYPGMEEIEWRSSDNDIAAVAGGRIVGRREGTATITAKSVDGKVSSVCTVTVKYGDGIRINSLTAQNGVLGYDIGIRLSDKAAGKAVIGIYDIDGALLGIGTLDLSGDAATGINTTLTGSLSFDSSLLEKATEVRVFVWESLTSANPLCSTESSAI